MFTDLKQNEISLVFGGKKLAEHVCGVLKEVIKGAGLGYCLALNPENARGMFERVGQWNEPKKKAVCSAVVIGVAEVMYHFSEEYLFSPDKPTKS